MQSVPVSPPPMTMTCLSFASMKVLSYFDLRSECFAAGSSKSRCWLRVRNSIAKTTPLRSRPGMGRLFGTVEPMARTVASKPELIARVRANLDAGAEGDALLLHQRDPPRDLEEGGCGVVVSGAWCVVRGAW